MTESDYNKVTQGLMENSRQRHQLRMLRVLTAAAIFGCMAVGLVYALVTQPMSKSSSGFMIFGAAVCGLYTVCGIFTAGSEAAKKYSEPKLWEKESRYQKLLKDFDESRTKSMEHATYLLEHYMYLFYFIANRSPEILAEFRAWRKQHPQPSAEEKKV